MLMQNPEGKFALQAYREWVVGRRRSARRSDTGIARRYANDRIGQNAAAFSSGTEASCEFISTPGRVDGTLLFVKRIAKEKQRKLLTFCKDSNAVQTRLAVSSL